VVSATVRKRDEAVGVFHDPDVEAVLGRVGCASRYAHNHEKETTGQQPLLESAWHKPKIARPKATLRRMRNLTCASVLSSEGSRLANDERSPGLSTAKRTTMSKMNRERELKEKRALKAGTEAREEAGRCRGGRD
jgi:hypothetical protein